MSKNLFEHFEYHARTAPGKTALIFGETSLTYGELYRDVTTLAYHLHRLGVARGTHIALFENNSAAFATIMMSCACLGATMVPLPLTLKGAYRDRALEATDCDYVIGWHAVVQKLRSAQRFAPEQLIALGRPVEGCRFYDELVAEPHDFSPPYEVPADSRYILSMTSGSTGEPKPVIFSQKTKINRSLIATQAFYGLSDSDVILASTPMYHSLAQRSVLLPLITGATSVILGTFSPKSWLEAVERHRVTFLFAVSSQLEQLAAYLSGRESDLSSLRTIVSSSALLRESVKVRLLQTFECDIHECYGASEVGVVTDLRIAEKLGSVGKPLPFVDLKIVDNEIACRSMTAFDGYYRNPEATAAAYDDEGFFYTGDIGEVDGEGYLYYRGRTKEVIITGAVNVYPKDIEDLIVAFDAVQECAVIGVEDGRFGEAVAALMTAKEGCSIDLRAVRKACLENLTDYQMPRYFDIVDAFPKSSLGKIQKSRIVWRP